MASRHLHLGGYQCTFQDPLEYQPELQNLVDMIADIMDWDSFKIPSEMDVLDGNRTSNYRYSDVVSDYDGIDEFLETEQVFSYAVPNGGRSNFTTDIDIRNR